MLDAESTGVGATWLRVVSTKPGWPPARRPRDRCRLRERLAAVPAELVPQIGILLPQGDQLGGLLGHDRHSAWATQPTTWSSKGMATIRYLPDRFLQVGIANKRLAAAWNGDNLRRLVGLKTTPVKMQLSLEASERNSFNETALGKEEGQENRQGDQ